MLGPVMHTKGTEMPGAILGGRGASPLRPEVSKVFTRWRGAPEQQSRLSMDHVLGLSRGLCSY